MRVAHKLSCQSPLPQRRRQLASTQLQLHLQVPPPTLPAPQPMLPALLHRPLPFPCLQLRRLSKTWLVSVAWTVSGEEVVLRVDLKRSFLRVNLLF
jgi:hypothetical protein